MAKPNFSDITRMYAKAGGGDKEALSDLYEVALQTLPKTSGNNRWRVIESAALQILNDATADGPLWVDEDLNITLPDFKQSVIEAVAPHTGDRTVDRHWEKSDNMLALAIKYIAANGGFKSE